MKIRILAAFAALTLLTAVAASAADDIQTQLKAAYDSQCTSFKNSDVDAAGKTLTDDFTNTTPDGKIETKADSLAGMKANLGKIIITDCTTSFVSLTPDAAGNEVASIISTQNGAVPGMGNAALLVVSRDVDTWTQQHGVWMEKKSTELEQTVTVNGNVIAHSGTALLVVEVARL